MYHAIDRLRAGQQLIVTIEGKEVMIRFDDNDDRGFYTVQHGADLALHYRTLVDALMALVEHKWQRE